MSAQSPCMSCGACCAYFRVSFYWGECQSAGGTVPDSQVIAVSPHLVAMIGTDRKPARCANLLGDVGSEVRCTMYEQRSSTCREFPSSWENGVHNPDCDKARAAHGLPPLPRPFEPELTPVVA